MKHTPGPWTILKQETELGNNLTIVAPDPGDPQPWYVAEVYKECGQVPEEEVDGNANLIAAAPDLLYALKQIVQDLPANRDWLDPVIELAAKDAIAKATGK